MANNIPVHMSNDMISLLNKLGSFENKERFLEGMAIIGSDVSRRIIAKAASPHSPVAIDEFSDISETTMIKHLHLLHGIGVLKPIWEESKKKYAITDFGRAIDHILENGNTLPN